MNANTLKAIDRHGRSLLQAFPNATEKNPVALCKKLRRIETAIARPLTDYCNGTIGIEAVDNATDAALLRVRRLLGLTEAGAVAIGLFINRDPRGYAIKLDDAWTREYNSDKYTAEGLPLYRDWGGYGIIAPDLTVESAVAA